LFARRGVPSLPHTLLVASLSARSAGASTMSSPTKKVKTVLPTTRPHWVGDGFHVYPVFSNLAFSKHLSPFLMFDYGAPREFPPNTSSQRKGVGQHPHRGFETVTIAFQGEVEHADSIGNKGVIGPGDVQWMTAGRGIIHQEFHSEKWAKQGGMFEMCQLWVNLPAKHKMTKPRYQDITKDKIPTVHIRANPAAPGGAGDAGASATCTADDSQGSVRIIAGEYGGVKGPALTWTPVNMLIVQLNDKGKTYQLTLPEDHNVMVFARRGGFHLQEGGKKQTALAPQSIALMEMGGTQLVPAPPTSHPTVPRYLERGGGSKRGQGWPLTIMMRQTIDLGCD